jgi:hypothetical protein
VAVDLFAERLGKIRTRFTANLLGKVDGLDKALLQISGDGPAVAEALATAHRGVHELCGIGPTIGFIATGQAARSVERILILALRAKRGLTVSETAGVRAGLGALRAAAQAEIQTTNGRSE